MQGCTSSCCLSHNDVHATTGSSSSASATLLADDHKEKVDRFAGHDYGLQRDGVMDVVTIFRWLSVCCKIEVCIGALLFRFVEVAAEWSAALLSGADQERHGVDLFGRDALLLGRIITCQVLLYVNK